MLITRSWSQPFYIFRRQPHCRRANSDHAPEFDWGRIVVFSLVCGLLDGRNQYKQTKIKKHITNKVYVAWLDGRNQYKQNFVRELNKYSVRGVWHALSIFTKVVRCEVRYVGFVIEVVRFIYPKIL